MTRDTREVGSKEQASGQARVEGVAGTWKDLTDNVNLMAANLTGQVRNMAEVTPAAVNGNTLEEGHRRCARRDFGAEIDHQYNGRSVEFLRRRSDARGA